MTDILLHAQTEADVEAYLSGRSHALLINGPAGAGKYFLARHISSKLLGIEPLELKTYPFLLNITAPSTSIGIEEIRQLHNFLKLKTTGDQGIRRIVIIENSPLMTEEAQNSLLKALEEPPVDTVIIMTTTSPQSLLPTILSRVQQLAVKNPALDRIKKYYSPKNPVEIDQAYKLSAGSMGLTDAILSSNQTHGLFSDVQVAKQLLQASAYDRLLIVEELSKDRQRLNGLLYALKQIASSTLLQTGQSSKKIDVKRWHQVLKEVHLAERRLNSSTSPKLAMTDLALHM